MARMKNKKTAGKSGKKKIIYIIVLVISLLLLTADLGFYIATNKMASRMQEFSSFTSGSFHGMNYSEDSTESTDHSMPAGMPSMSSGESGGAGNGSGSNTANEMSSGDSGTNGNASAPGTANEMPSGDPGTNGNASAPGTANEMSSGTSGTSDTGTAQNGGNNGSGFTTGITKMIALRRFCIPAAVVLALIAVFCIIMLIRIHKQEKKNRRYLLDGLSGENGEGALTEEEAESLAARRAVEESIARRSKAKRRNALLALFLVLALILLAVVSSYVKSKNTTANTSIEEETLSGTVEKGSINTNLQGYGTLTAEEACEVTIPGSVEVISYAVSNGDRVESGELIATVDKTTVLSSIAELQTLMDQLDAELDEVSGDTISDQVTAAADGRVMAVYAADGTSVVDTMYTNQALMILSLDGLMAVDFTTEESKNFTGAGNTYTVGTAISVVTEDGDTYTGRVANIDNDTVTVTLTDDGPQLNDTVTLKDSGGNTIATGTLYVHSPLKVTGFAGTVEAVDVAVGDEVEEGDTLLELTDTDYSANYDTMVQQREVLENQMSVLMRAYMTGGVYADQKGVISGIGSDSEDSTALSSIGDSNVSYTGKTYGAQNDTQTVYTITVASAGETTVDSGFYGGEASPVSETGNEGSSGTIESEGTAGGGEGTSQDTGSGEESSNPESSGSGSEGETTSQGGNTDASASGINSGSSGETSGQTTGNTGSGDSSTAESTTTGLTAEQLSQLALWLSNLDSATLNQILSQLDYSVLKQIYDIMVSYSGGDSSADGETTGDDAAESDTTGDDAAGKTTPGGDTSGGIVPGGDGTEGTEAVEGTETEEKGSPSGGATAGSTGSSGTSMSSVISSLTGGTASGSVSSANISADAATAIMSSTEAGDAEEAEEENTYVFSETELCTLTPDDTMTIDITVDELDILSVLVNTGVQVTLDAFEGQSFDGTITYIDIDGSNSGGDTKYTVTVTIDRNEDMLTGMNANVSIRLDTKENILTVPVAAIKEEGTESYIYTGYDEKTGELTNPVEITTGVSDGTNAEILSGLEEGDTYYYQYAGTITYNFVK